MEQVVKGARGSAGPEWPHDDPCNFRNSQFSKRGGDKKMRAFWLEEGVNKWGVPPGLTYLGRGLKYMFARFRAVNIFTKFGVRLEGYS